MILLTIWSIIICANYISVSDAYENYKPENQAKNNTVICDNNDGSYIVYNKVSGKTVRIYTEIINEENNNETLESINYIDVHPNTIININNIDELKEIHIRSAIEAGTNDLHSPDDKFNGIIVVHKIKTNEKIKEDITLQEDNSWYVWNHSDKPVVFHIDKGGQYIYSKYYKNVAPHRHLNEIEMNNYVE